MTKNKIVTIEFWLLLRTIYVERVHGGHTYESSVHSIGRLLDILEPHVRNPWSPWFQTHGDRGYYIGHLWRMYRVAAHRLFRELDTLIVGGDKE